MAQALRSQVIAQVGGYVQRGLWVVLHDHYMASGAVSHGFVSHALMLPAYSSSCQTAANHRDTETYWCLLASSPFW